MEKKKLSDFLSRYYLNGNGAEAVLLECGDNVSTTFYGPDKTMIGFVTLKHKMDIGSVGIFQTGVFSNLLKAFSDTDVLVVTSKKNSSNNIVALELKCGKTLVNATTADPAIIPEIDFSKIDTENSKLKNEPPFDFEFNLDTVFMDNFKRLSSAANADIFAFVLDGGICKMVMNYSKTNVNSIVVELDNVTVTNPADCVICFRTVHFQELFNANKNLTSGSVKISRAGLGRLDMENNDFSCRYYPLKIDLQ